MAGVERDLPTGIGIQEYCIFFGPLQQKASLMGHLGLGAEIAKVPHHGRDDVFPWPEVGSQVPGFVAPVAEVAPGGASAHRLAVDKKPIAVISCDVDLAGGRCGFKVKGFSKVDDGVGLALNAGMRNPAGIPGSGKGGLGKQRSAEEQGEGE